MISVVTPTFRRPEEVQGLLQNLAQQSLLPDEVILVDGAEPSETATEVAVKQYAPQMPFAVRYIRHGGGTAIQRNVGIDMAQGDLVAFIDDDVRLFPDFLQTIEKIYSADPDRAIGGVVGYRANQHFTAAGSSRWRWYKRLRLLTVFEPGRYDYHAGYPINNNLQPPFDGIRHVDFMTTACSVWRREVFDSGLRFDPFFADYGVLEDAHFALRAGRTWRLVQAGDALCEEAHSPNGRANRRKLGYKCVVNYYYVFREIAGPLNRKQKLRFWQFQAFDFFRIAISAFRRRRWSDVEELGGRLEGAWHAIKGIPANGTEPRVEVEVVRAHQS